MLESQNHDIQLLDKKFAKLQNLAMNVFLITLLGYLNGYFIAETITDNDKKKLYWDVYIPSFISAAVGFGFTVTDIIKFFRNNGDEESASLIEKQPLRGYDSINDDGSEESTFTGFCPKKSDFKVSFKSFIIANRSLLLRSNFLTSVNVGLFFKVWPFFSTYLPENSNLRAFLDSTYGAWTASSIATRSLIFLPPVAILSSSLFIYHYSLKNFPESKLAKLLNKIGTFNYFALDTLVGIGYAAFLGDILSSANIPISLPQIQKMGLVLSGLMASTAAAFFFPKNKITNFLRGANGFSTAIRLWVYCSIEFFIDMLAPFSDRIDTNNSYLLGMLFLSFVTLFGPLGEQLANLFSGKPIGNASYFKNPHVFFEVFKGLAAGILFSLLTQNKGFDNLDELNWENLNWSVLLGSSLGLLNGVLQNSERFFAKFPNAQYILKRCSCSILNTLTSLFIGKAINPEFSTSPVIMALLIESDFGLELLRVSNLFKPVIFLRDRISDIGYGLLVNQSLQLMMEQNNWNLPGISTAILPTLSIIQGVDNHCHNRNYEPKKDSLKLLNFAKNQLHAASIFMISAALTLTVFLIQSNKESNITLGKSFLFSFYIFSTLLFLTHRVRKNMNIQTKETNPKLKLPVSIDNEETKEKYFSEGTITWFNEVKAKFVKLKENNEIFSSCKKTT